MIVRRLAFTVLFALTLFGCAATSATSSGDSSAGIVVVETDVDAFLTIGGGAPVPLQGGEYNAVPMSPGYYTMSIESEGYLTRRYDLRVNPNEEVRIRLAMWPTVEELDLED